MTQSFRDELADLVGPAPWHNLLPHAAKDTLVVVTSGLALADVGVAIANDQVTVVDRWISEALIAKPTAQQLEDWDRDRAREFQTLIVQPYVLIQENA